MPNWETFQTAYLSAPETTKVLIDSDKIPVCVQKQVQAKTIDATLQSKVVLLLSHYQLATLTKDEVIAQCTQIGIPGASAVFQELESCTKSPIRQESIASSAQPAEAAVNETLESEIAETEAALNAIPQMRTMAQDAQETTEHTSSQSELLEKSNRWTPKQ